MSQSSHYQPRVQRRRSQTEKAPAARQTARPRRKTAVSYASETAARARRQPPVLVRGGLPWMPEAPAKTAKARRRYDLTLNVPGVEMRLPALPQVSFGMRSVSGLLLAILALLLYHLWNSPSYRVQAAQITGLQRLTKNDVGAVLNVRGEPIFTLSPRALEARLSDTFPEFSAVSVEVALPNKVSVTVKERVPVLIWKQDNRTLLVDASGVAFPLREPAVGLPGLVVEAHGAPLAQEGEAGLNQPLRLLPVEMVSAILSLRGYVPANTSIVFDSVHGLGWKDAGGWEVYLGKVADVDMKLKLYQEILKKLDKEDIMPALISIEFPHAPYYRTER
ncbi:MAG: FtsQ-type POTRA domain-containing protein [Chloroflexi bacterium]|nr:FtsQ-type POTRA domain-containing protein [Chloroflexota bacterium]